MLHGGSVALIDTLVPHCVIVILTRARLQRPHMIKTPGHLMYVYSQCAWHTHIHTHKRTNTHTNAQTHTHTYARCASHTHIHTQTHKHTHTRTHKYTHLWCYDHGALAQVACQQARQEGCTLHCCNVQSRKLGI